MAQGGGRLGSLQPAAATNKTLYKPGAGVIATVTVRMQNVTVSAVNACSVFQVQNAAADPAPAAGECVVSNRTLNAKGDVDGLDHLEITMVLNGNNNDQVVVNVGTSTAVDCTCDGVTES